MRRVGCELVAPLSAGRRVERQRAVGVEVQPAVCRFHRWPLVEGAPAVGAGVEQPCLGEPAVPLALEPVGEPARLELAILDAGGTAEADVAQRRAGITGPLPVVPGTH